MDDERHPLMVDDSVASCAQRLAYDEGTHVVRA